MIAKVIFKFEILFMINVWKIFSPGKLLAKSRIMFGMIVFEIT